MTRSLPPGHHRVALNLSETLYQAIEKRRHASGESLDHIVQSALAEALGIEHHTLFQVSTSTAIVEGLYQGCVTVGKIKEHGDFGLGTFDSLDGEGIMLDGRVYQALANGIVREASNHELTPFWVCAYFEPDRTIALTGINEWGDLCAGIDASRTSENLFTAIRIQGQFEAVNYRVACKTESGTNLVTATSHQAEFRREDFSGSLLGFWTPAYAKTLNVPGYHLHLLSDDHQSAGHLLDIRAHSLTLELMDAPQLLMSLPETKAFLEANLNKDPSADLETAEGTHQKRA